MGGARAYRLPFAAFVLLLATGDALAQVNPNTLITWVFRDVPPSLRKSTTTRARFP